MTLTPRKNPVLNTFPHPPRPAPNFTLHFTADVIWQISAHLGRILTDFDGLSEENHYLLLQSTVL